MPDGAPAAAARATAVGCDGRPTPLGASETWSKLTLAIGAEGSIDPRGANFADLIGAWRNLSELYDARHDAMHAAFKCVGLTRESIQKLVRADERRGRDGEPTAASIDPSGQASSSGGGGGARLPSPVHSLLQPEGKARADDGVTRFYVSAGLANRLRTILAVHYTDVVHARRTLAVTWYVDHPLCNGDFSDVFEPLSNTHVVPALLSRPDWRHWSAALHNDEFPSANHAGWVSARHVPGLNLAFLPILGEARMRPADPDDAWRIEVAHTRLLRPLPALRERIRRFVADHGINESIAVHVRRSDHVAWKPRAQSQTSDGEFFGYIDAQPSRRVFLATDDAAVAKMMLERYGPERIILSSSFDQKTLRQTTLADAVVDMYVAAHAHSFHGSRYSSFSRLIAAIGEGLRERTARFRADADADDDDHNLARLPWGNDYVVPDSEPDEDPAAPSGTESLAVAADGISD